MNSTPDIDTTYRKEILTFDLVNNGNYSLNHKFTDYLKIILWGIGFILLGLIFPFLPSRSASYHTPKNLNDYLHEIKGWSIAVITMCLIVAFITRLKYLRIKYDIRKDYQKEGVFKIKRIIDLGTSKLLLLNNYHRLIIKINTENFYEVKSGQKVKIIKSASNKLLQYKIIE